MRLTASVVGDPPRNPVRHTGQAAGRPWPAQEQVQRTNLIEPSQTVFLIAAAHKRMLEQAEQRHRCKILRRRLCQCQHEGPDGHVA